MREGRVRAKGEGRGHTSMHLIRGENMRTQGTLKLREYARMITCIGAMVSTESALTPNELPLIL